MRHSDSYPFRVAEIKQAEKWAQEPFLRPDEKAEEVLAAGSARRRALEDALAEQEAGRKQPSAQWKIRYGLLLGLERVLAEEAPKLKDGTELRRHQTDALAGMLTELIAASQCSGENGNGETNGNGNGAEEANGLEEADDDEEDELVADPLDDEEALPDDPGISRRYRFRHPTAAGKTVAAAGFVEAASSLGVLILTHRRLLVDQFRRELTERGYQERLHAPLLTSTKGKRPTAPVTIETYAWFTRHVTELDREVYQLVICDEAHTALGEKTSAAIRSLSEPLYIGMTATEELIAKQVSDVFPLSVDDLPLKEASRRGLVAPLRCLRVPPVAAINSVPIVGGDFDQELLAKTLDHQALNQAAASLYRERFGDTPGIVYAAGVKHAYNLATEFRAAGLKAEAVSGKTPPLRLAETLAAYERGEINVLVNAMLLAEGWNSPRATVCMHLAPTASKRVYQQRIGRVMRLEGRKEAGVVVDFVAKGTTHSSRVVSLHSLLDVDFYREGARVLPAPRRRLKKARRTLRPSPWLVPVSSDPSRRLEVIRTEWQRLEPSGLDASEQELWAGLAGRQAKFEERTAFVARLTQRGVERGALERFLESCAAENPHQRLRLMALQDRVSMGVATRDFDDLVSLVSQAPTWLKERPAGVRVLLLALAAGKAEAPDQIKGRWLWRLAAATRKNQDRRATELLPEAKGILGAVANSRAARHEANMKRLVTLAHSAPLPVAVGLLAATEGYTPRAVQTLDRAREEIATPEAIATALAENLPSAEKKKRRKRKKTAAKGAQVTPAQASAQPGSGKSPSANGEQKRRRRRRRRKPAAKTQSTPTTSVPSAGTVVPSVPQPTLAA